MSSIAVDGVHQSKSARRWTTGSRLVIAILGMLFSGLVAPPADAADSADSAARPNVVLLLVDDLGYGDLSCYGADDVSTPNIDQLAQQGVRFTHHYSNGPECSPTRTALMTGRYQQRAGGLECAIGTGNVGRYDDAVRLAKEGHLGLPAHRFVLPLAFREAGYRTAAFGKWHLGYEPEYNPLNCGFDEFFGILGGNVDYFTHRELSPLPVLLDDREPVERAGYLTHLLAEEATQFIERHPSQPFFLYVPFTAPHFPFQAPGDEAVVFNAENWMAGTRDKYVELLEDLDAAVGRVVQSLSQTGLTENTLIIFASDNGAISPGSNTPLRDFKSTLYEGAIRVPCIARWPNRLPEDVTETQPLLTMDLTCSLIRIANEGRAADQPLDGIDILAHAEQQLPNVARDLFWRARRGERTERAVRSGNWKFLHRRLDDGSEQRYLFNLHSDPGEQQNLLARRIGDADKLQRLLREWEKEVRPND